MKYTLSKLAFYLLFGISFFSTLWAQTEENSMNNAQKIETLIALKKEINQERFSNQYFAIQIYNGSALGAQKAFEAFKIDFPQVEIELSFETPNYKVRVGRYKDFLEANKQLEALRKQYPNAFLLEPNNL